MKSQRRGIRGPCVGARRLTFSNRNVPWLPALHSHPDLWTSRVLLGMETRVILTCAVLQQIVRNKMIMSLGGKTPTSVFIYNVYCIL